VRKTGPFLAIREFTGRVLAMATKAESRLANRRVGSSQKANLERLRSGDITGKVPHLGGALKQGEFL